MRRDVSGVLLLVRDGGHLARCNNPGLLLIRDGDIFPSVEVSPVCTIENYSDPFVRWLGRVGLGIVMIQGLRAGATVTDGDYVRSYWKELALCSLL